MIEIRAHVEIERPAGEVFTFLADMANNPTWQKGMQECRWTSDPPLRLGSTYDQVARFLGKEIVSSFEVTEYEEGRLIRIESTAGPMTLDITRSVDAGSAGRSTVSAIVRGDSSGVYRLADPIMRLLVGRSVRADYRRLKAHLES
ncbi:MAG: SRPBCC family protein [Acidimicrobiia bacterium]|nr:SRPBCC family protein [Acidimicrobiia bacterium]